MAGSGSRVEVVRSVASGLQPIHYLLRHGRAVQRQAS
jgi:hypothetical protein